MSARLARKTYRLTGLHESGHVDSIKLHRCDEQIGSSEPATNVAATLLKDRNESPARSGLLPAPPKKKPFERKPPLPDVKAKAE